MIFIGQVSQIIIDGVRKIISEIYQGYTKTAYQINPPGLDSSPLPGDQGVTLDISKSNGKSVQIGVYSESEVEPGESKLYSRDPNTGEINFFIHMSGQGIVMSDADGLNKIELNPGGVVFTVAGVTYGAATHIHGTGVGPSSPPNPNT